MGSKTSPIMPGHLCVSGILLAALLCLWHAPASAASSQPPAPSSVYGKSPQLQPGAITGLDGALDIKSSFFEARLLAEVGETRARLETVFQRGKDNKLVMLRRLSGGAE